MLTSAWLWVAPATLPAAQFCSVGIDEKGFMTRTMPDGWILPAIEPLTEAFFTSGRMLLQHCTSCDYIQHPPEDVCHRCQGMEFDTREFGSMGTIYSYTVVRHAVDPMLAEEVPYTVVLVALDEVPHVRVVGNLRNCQPDNVHIGMRVEAVWSEVTDPDSEICLLIPEWQAKDQT